MFKKVFTNLINALYEQEPEDRIIYSLKKDDSFVLADDEEFKQCYSKKDKNRKVLAEYYFLSNKGHLVSVYNKKLTYIKPEREERNGRGSYNLTVYNKDTDRYERKRISSTDLMAAVFRDSIKTYGKAGKIYEKKGLFAFGRNGSEGTIQAHHIDCDKTNDVPENIELVTTDKIHKIIHKTNKDNPNDILRLMNTVLEEEPNKCTVIGAADNYKIIDTKDKLIFTENGYKSLQNMLNDFKTLWLYNNSISILKNEFGKDYFNTPKYIYINNRFFKADIGFLQTPIELTENDPELVDKNYIVCALNDKGQTVCYIEN